MNESCSNGLNLVFYAYLIHYLYDSKLDTTVKNRFQILILHPKKHIIEETKTPLFYIGTFAGRIPYSSFTNNFMSYNVFK